MRARSSSFWIAPFLLVLPFVAHASISIAPREGIRVSTIESPASQPLIVPDGQGGAYIAWRDLSRPYYPVLYAQHLTRDGRADARWPAEGQQITGYSARAVRAPYARSTVIADHVTMIADGAQGAFIAWDEGDPSYWSDIWLAHIVGGPSPPRTHVVASPEQAGTGGPSGIGLEALLEPEKHEDGTQYPSLAPDGAGGFYLAFQFNGWYYGPELRVARYGADLAPVSTFNLDRSAGRPAICSDGRQGAFVVSTTTPWNATNDLLTSHLDVGPSTPLCSESGAQYAPGLVPDGEGGAFVVWEDQRNGSFDQIYAQRVGAGGAGWPSGGIPVSSSSSRSGTIDFGNGEGDSVAASSVASDAAGGFIVAWTDYRDGSGFGAGNIFAQRIGGDGTRAPGWDEQGVAVCAAAGEQRHPRIVADGEGGAFIVWQDQRDGGMIYAQHLDATGRPAPGWAADGEAVCDAGVLESVPVVCADGVGGAWVAWRDERAGSPRIFASHILDGGAEARVSRPPTGATPENALATTGLALEPVRPNPTSRRFAVAFTLPGSGGARLDLIDPSGRVVLTHEINRAFGRQTLELDPGESARPGLYWLRLRQGPAMRVSRVAILR